LSFVGSYVSCTSGGIRPDFLAASLVIAPIASYRVFTDARSNVDRLIAIWQTLHIDSWFDGSDPRDKDGGTFAILPGTADKPTGKLRPFHKTPLAGEEPNDAYWTSQDCREVTALGYTYVGLEKWHYLKSDRTYDRDAHIAALSRQLNIDYNSAWSAAEKSALTKDPGEAHGVNLMSLPALQVATKKQVMDLEFNDYVVNVVYEKFALGGNSFTIHIFIGDPPASAPYNFQGGWQVGQVFNFSTEPGDLGASPAGCGNCQEQQLTGAASSGRVILTNALITRWKHQVPHGSSSELLASMEPEHVVDFLKKHMHWRVSSFEEEVPLDRIPSLKVSVARGKARHYADRSRLSEFGGYVPVYEVTQGRPGGAEPADRLYPEANV
jgi:tyrosinase